MDESLFLNIQKILRRYRKRFAIAFSMVLISNLLMVFNPLIFRQAVMAIDSNTGDPEGILHVIFLNLYGSSYHNIWVWAATLLFIAGLAAYFKYRMRVRFISISREEERRVRELIFEKVQMQSRKFYDDHTIGELISFLTNDIAVYREVLGPGIMYPIYCITLLLPGISALFLISPPLAILSLLPLLLIPLLNGTVRRYIYNYSLKVQTKIAILSGTVQEHFSGIRIIKSYGAEGNISHTFNEMSKKLVRDNMYLACLQGLLYPLFTLITKITTIFLVILSGGIILKGWSQLSTADFISFMWIQSYIYIPVLMLGWVLPVYERGRAAYDRLNDAFSEPIEVEDNSTSKFKIDKMASIRLSNLTFAYPHKTNTVLDDISLEIEGGTFVGITGPVGSGKSTLFKLIDREYKVPDGVISIGGRDIHEYPLSAFHEEIISVEQIPFLFSKTIAENVGFGDEQVSSEAIEIVAKHADLHETIVEFPKQYETIVGERGMKLSGGQKQRVAIARAFLVDRSILLLDDIFSAVDSETEKRIFASLKKYFKGKTILLITHRVSILDKLDRVIYLDKGKIIEDGPPQELKKRKGHYWALSELQRLDN